MRICTQSVSWNHLFPLYHLSPLMTQNHNVNSYILHQPSDFRHLPTLTRPCCPVFFLTPQPRNLFVCAFVHAHIYIRACTNARKYANTIWWMHTPFYSPALKIYFLCTLIIAGVHSKKQFSGRENLFSCHENNIPWRGIRFSWHENNFNHKTKQ